MQETIQFLPVVSFLCCRRHCRLLTQPQPTLTVRWTKESRIFSAVVHCKDYLVVCIYNQKEQSKNCFIFSEIQCKLKNKQEKMFEHCVICVKISTNSKLLTSFKSIFHLLVILQLFSFHLEHLHLLIERKQRGRLGCFLFSIEASQKKMKRKVKYDWNVIFSPLRLADCDAMRHLIGRVCLFPIIPVKENLYLGILGI